MHERVYYDYCLEKLKTAIYAAAKGHDETEEQDCPPLSCCPEKIHFFISSFAKCALIFHSLQRLTWAEMTTYSQAGDRYSQHFCLV
jgi:hypothetical protein